jgi:hypothetical protein
MGTTLIAIGIVVFLVLVVWGGIATGRQENQVAKAARMQQEWLEGKRPRK